MINVELRRGVSASRLTMFTVAGLLIMSSLNSPAAHGRDSAAPVSVDAWIARDGLPFTVASPATFIKSVDKAVASLGPSVELLGFGEALHGGQEILQLRNELFKHLVMTKGFSAIAIESSFARAWLVNDYVTGNGPATYDEVMDKGFSEGVGHLTANRELVEWMRTYNADPSHPVKLHFYAFDIPTGAVGIASPAHVLHVALEYLGAIDPAAANEHRQKIDSLLPADAAWENPMAWADTKQAIGGSPAATSLRIATEDLITELRTRRPELVAHSSEDRYLQALHNAVVARELLNFHAVLARKSGEPPAGPRGIRDALMADNLVYIVDRERGHGRVMVFAHNGHLQRGKSTWPCCGQKYLGTDVYTWWPAGSQLQQMLGDRYAVIGTAVGESQQNEIARPEAGSLEARLTAQKETGLLIQTHGGRGIASDEVAGLPTRSGSMLNLTYTALVPQSFTDFNWLCVLDSVTYSQGGKPLSHWDNSPKK